MSTLRGPLDDLAERLTQFTPDPNNPHDKPMLAAAFLALLSARAGNFGVGAVIVRDGEIFTEGRNWVMRPHFASGKHAEPDALDKVEQTARGDHLVHRGSTMYTTLEPCPMCTGRLIIAGPDAVYYAAADSEGGMVSRLQHMPPVFLNIKGDRIIEQSTCSPDLATICFDIFLTTVREIDAHLAEQG